MSASDYILPAAVLKKIRQLVDDEEVYVELYIVCAIMKIDYHLPLRAPMLA